MASMTTRSGHESMLSLFDLLIIASRILKKKSVFRLDGLRQHVNCTNQTTPMECVEAPDTL